MSRYRSYHRERGQQPNVDVILAHTRPLEHAWCVEAVQSVERQSYPHTGLWTVDNTDHALHLGEAWNLGLSQSAAELVLFLREEDALTPDLVESLVTFYLRGKEENSALVHCTSLITVLDDRGRTAMAPVAHTGMWERKALIASPWSDELNSHLERDQLARMSAALTVPQALTVGIAHHYGYLWRNHAFRIDRIRTNEG